MQRIQQALGLVQVACQRGQIGVIQLVNASHGIHRHVKKSCAVLCRRARLREQHRRVRRIHAVRMQSLPHGFQKGARVRVRLNLFVCAQNHVAQLFIVAPRGQQVTQREKARVAALIRRVHHLFQHLSAQDFSLLRIHQTEIRRNAERSGLFPRQRQAQRMYGCDFGAMHQKQLPTQARILRVACDRLCQCRADAFAHFGGGGIGKGHQQQPVDIHRVFRVGQTGEHPLDQHGGLA